MKNSIKMSLFSIVVELEDDIKCLLYCSMICTYVIQQKVDMVTQTQKWLKLKVYKLKVWTTTIARTSRIEGGQDIKNPTTKPRNKVDRPDLIRKIGHRELPRTRGIDLNLETKDKGRTPRTKVRGRTRRTKVRDQIPTPEQLKLR